MNKKAIQIFMVDVKSGLANDIRLLTYITFTNSFHLGALLRQPMMAPPSIKGFLTTGLIALKALTSLLQRNAVRQLQLWEYQMVAIHG